MRGFLYYGNNNAKFSNEVPEPKIKTPNELILDVAFCGICGSDVHELLDGPIFFPKEGKGHELSNIPAPQCMGHEFSGIVREIGSEVTKFKPGDHVVVEATAHCSDRKRFPENNPRIDTPTCEECKNGLTNICKYGSFTGLGVSDGAFAERIVVGEEHVLKIPDSLPLDIAALVEPLSVAWHAVRLSGFKAGQSALVIGSGPIGLATILALQGHNAGIIVASEPAKIRREQAEKLKVNAVVNPMEYDDAIAQLKQLSGPKGNGFDYTFDASGIQVTYTTSIKALAPHGTAVNIAIWPDRYINTKPMDLTFHEKFYCGSMGYTPKDFEQVIEALADGRIDIEKCKTLITGKISLEDTYEKGFLELINNKDRNIKILVTPQKI